MRRVPLLAQCRRRRSRPAPGAERGRAPNRARPAALRALPRPADGQAARRAVGDRREGPWASAGATCCVERDRIPRNPRLLGLDSAPMKGRRPNSPRCPPALGWGMLFFVRSLFSYELGALVSPFLLLDYAAPKEFEASGGARRGVGEHPHRGFETVTLVYRGEVEHRDSGGHSGPHRPGRRAVDDGRLRRRARGVPLYRVHENRRHGRDGAAVGEPARPRTSSPLLATKRSSARASPKSPWPAAAGTARVRGRRALR